jgi:hypothetical protein
MTPLSSNTPVPSPTASRGRKVEAPVKPQTLAENVAPSKPKFKTDMPNIPGVANADASQDQVIPTNWGRAAIAIGALLVLGSAGGWMMTRTTHHTPAAAAAPILQPSPPPGELPAAPVSLNAASNDIGTSDELAAPWSSKKFTYTRPLNHEQVPAIAIRLPGGNGHTASSFWVILLKAPFGQCQLDYVIDTNLLATRFNFNASHPMIADSCNNTLYDPLRMGTLPNGSWARGEIVHGAGFRPPFQVEIHLDGNKLVAGRAED